MTEFSIAFRRKPLKMSDCSEGSISHSEMNSNRTPAIFTIGHAEKSRETPPEREMANSVTKKVKFNSQNDIKQLTTEEARKELTAILRRNIFGFFLGVLASMFIAIGTSCTQVTQLFS